MKKIILITITISTILLASCGGGNTVELAGTSWKLVSYAGIIPIEGKAMTANFDADQISGSASCNHYFGGYQIKGDQFSVDGLGWTEMACLDPEGIMEQEQIIMSMLSQAANYLIIGDTLEVKTTNGDILLFQTLN